MGNRGVTWRRVAGGVALLGLAWAGGARGEERYWVGGSGDWNAPANWSLTPGGPGGAGMPGADDSVNVVTEDGVDREIVVASNAVSGSNLDVDAMGGGSVVLRLTGAAFASSWMTLGSHGKASFVQTGGTHAAGYVSFGGEGTYELSGGTLQAEHLEMYSGRVTQTGGTAKVTKLVLGPGGEYRWQGGELQLGREATIGGAVSFPAAPTTWNLEGLIRFDRPLLTNAKNVSVVVGPNSVVSRSVGFDPATVFGSYSNAGLEHVIGSTLVIPAGREIQLAGRFADPVDVFGTISRPAGDPSLILGSGLILRAGGRIEVSEVQAAGDASQILGGWLTAEQLTAGQSGIGVGAPVTGRVRQEGGRVDAGVVNLGPAGLGEYRLLGGTLTTGQTLLCPQTSPFQIGGMRTGYFEQTGGTHATSKLLVGQGAGSQGAYVMSGGELRADELIVGGAYQWIFNQPPTWGVGELDLNSADARVEVTSELFIGPYGSLLAVPGASVHMKGADLVNRSGAPDQVAGLEVLRVVFEGGAGAAPNRLEVAGADVGAVGAGFSRNAAIDTLQVGGDGAAWVRLVDQWDNQPGSSGAEALYVRHLILNAGSTLDLGGLRLYVLDFVDGGGAVELGGGKLTVVPEPAALGGAVIGLLLVRRGRRGVR